jgi:hypothetical protein
MRRAPAATCLATALAVLLLQACDRSTGPTSDPESAQSGDFARLPKFDPANFVSGLSNRYFPLVPGTTYRYRSKTADGVAINTVEVTHDTKSILGVAATVVHDQVSVNSKLSEDTFDWYAQDKDGNVWYLGEDTKEYENGQVVSTEGSWEAGVKGASAGIIMWGDPAAHVGETYRQELFKREAEDVAMVVSLNSSADVPAGHFTDCLETIDWSLIEDVPPAEREHKFYCPDVGVVLESEGPASDPIRNELVSVAGP